MTQLFFRPKYVWFLIHLKGPMIPDPSGQLAELIVYITSTRVDLYSHQILLDHSENRLYSVKFESKFHNYNEENEFGNAVCSVSTILSGWQSVDSIYTSF